MQQVESEALSLDELKSFVKKTAEDENFCFFNIKGDFEIVSVKGLFTLWDDEDYEIVVYRRRADGRILVQYPDDSTEDSTSWEGSNPDDNYCLEMYQKEEMFDGSNGKLTDTGGKEIKCFSAKSSKHCPKTELTHSTRKSKRRRRRTTYNC